MVLLEETYDLGHGKLAGVSMSVTVLHCAPMTPQAFVHQDADGVTLLVETEQGLVLMDTGLGLQDHLAPNRYMKICRRLMGWHVKPESTAIQQLAEMGIIPEEIKHIILTHVHFDHAGGLPDFPNAQVHVHQREFDAIRRPKKFMDFVGHNKDNFAHKPDWRLYQDPVEDWFGFNAIRLPFTPSIYLVELHGHTSGHCGIAVEKEKGGWFFYVGDAAPANLDYGMAPDWLIKLVLGNASMRLKTLQTEYPAVEMIAGHVWAD